MTNKDDLLMETNVDGTVGISFHATGTAEHTSLVEMEEIGDSEKQRFTKQDFERSFKKTSRKIKK